MILTARDRCKNMADGIEKEEFGSHRRLDKHDHAPGDHCEESDNVDHADSIQNDVAWTSKRLP